MPVKPLPSPINVPLNEAVTVVKEMLDFNVTDYIKDPSFIKRGYL